MGYLTFLVEHGLKGIIGKLHGGEHVLMIAQQIESIPCFACMTQPKIPGLDDAWLCYMTHFISHNCVPPIEALDRICIDMSSSVAHLFQQT
jgi:hypothetical protein